jgi:hypothetical protein
VADSPDRKTARPLPTLCGVEPIEQALVNLTGAVSSISGRFASFRARERVTMITFAEDVIEERDFTVERGGADAAGLKQIRAYVGGLQLHGGTAIFTAMQRLPAGRRRRAARPGRLQGDRWLPVGSGCSATCTRTRTWPAGSVGGLVGLGLDFTGVVGDLWPLVVAGLYG